MSNDSIQEKPITTQTQASSVDIEAPVIQVLHLNTTLEDTRRYAYVKIVDLQETLASLLMRLEQTILPADQIPQAIEQVQEVIRKTSARLNHYCYNLRTGSLNPETFVACDIGNLITSALTDMPRMKFFSVEWINAHNFCFYGEEKISQAIIANILDAGYQAAYKNGKGKITLWTAQYHAFNQLHVKLDVELHSRRQDDKRWSNIAPQASFRLTLALCRRVITLSGGNVYLIPQAQGTHFVLSFPKIEQKT